MKYQIGQEFILHVPVKVVAVSLDNIVDDAVQYDIKGVMSDGTKLSGWLAEKIKKEEPCKN